MLSKHQCLPIDAYLDILIAAWLLMGSGFTLGFYLLLCLIFCTVYHCIRKRLASGKLELLVTCWVHRL